MQTAQQTNRLDFLFAAGFEMVSRVPALSRYYMSEFQHSLTEFELTTPKTVARLACPSCGQIRIPGLSTHVAVVERQKRKKGKRPGNRIKTTCARCCHTSFYHGSYKHKLPTAATATATAAAVPMTPVVIEKKKKNKGKKNSLKAMLNKSTQQQKESTGNLSDFLSFL
ncbi:uncharacterized protein EV154DRAFT_509986 [Mucor mucedo]|uniref:uncharacterized protein n=1 Tax=Mucor mucedo TaxID=29922 RepID=UPI002220E5BE|nr:uncharacterized protein EV154DRAFT_509986 [Mucor mucedo]KAI7890918.1 hypothetical protein EV154DRAFT_509986 [Mucor mucedo]